MTRTASLYLFIGLLCVLLYLFNILSPGQLSPLFSIAFTFITLGGLWVVYSGGTLKASRLRAGVLAGIVLIILSLVLKVQHWPFADAALFAGLGLIIVLYSIHFFSKPVKRLLDYLKIVWLLVRVAGTILVFFIDNRIAAMIIQASDILLLGLIFLHIYQNHDREIAAKKRGA